MEFLQKLVAIDLNYILIGLIVLFYSLEYFLENQIRITNRTAHWGNNIVLGMVFVGLNFCGPM